jgi:Spy/CpxP family protein refolding chaperone
MPINEQLRKEVRERVRTRLQHVAKELNLNDEQKFEIASVIEENVRNLRPMVAELVATNRAKLQEFLQDRTRVVDLLTKVHGEIETGVKEILTPEQQNKLQKIREERVAA